MNTSLMRIDSSRLRRWISNSRIGSIGWVNMWDQFLTQSDGNALNSSSTGNLITWSDFTYRNALVSWVDDVPTQIYIYFILSPP
jgi:hypothetical protein